MADIEPFLRGIFADPADDLPRLVFADWLDEHGQDGWAAAIRLGCELPTLAADDPRADRIRVELDRLLEDLPHAGPDRGFHPVGPIEQPADMFSDADAFRRLALTRFPHWYGAMRLKVTADRITHPAPLQTILTSPVTERVTDLDMRGQEIEVPGLRIVDLDLRGREIEVARLADGGPDGLFALTDFILQPVITVKMVEALARMRECRRLTALDLRNNDLDNDALRALAQSPYLHRVERLDLLEGNHRFKGRVWQQVRERFGPDVVQ